MGIVSEIERDQLTSKEKKNTVFGVIPILIRIVHSMIIFFGSEGDEDVA